MNIMALCPWLGNFFVKKKFSGKNSVKLEIAQKISNFFKIAIFENCTFFLILDHYAFSVWIFAALSILILNITNNIQIVDAVPQPGEVIKNFYYYFFYFKKINDGTSIPEIPFSGTRNQLKNG